MEEALRDLERILGSSSQMTIPDANPSAYLLLHRILHNPRYLDHFRLVPRGVRVVDREAFILDCCRGRNVLHIGCANAPLTSQKLEAGALLHQRLQVAAKRLVGIDISVEGIEALRAAGFEDVYVLDIAEAGKLPWRDFDMVLLGETLEHLANPGHALDALRTFSTASTVITVPNAHSWEGIAFSRRGIEFVNPDHCAYYSYWTLQTLLKKTGYAVVEVAYYSHRTQNDVVFSALQANPQFSEGLVCVAKVDDGKSVSAADVPQSIEQARTETATAHLVDRLAHEEEAVLALYHELVELNSRLSQLQFGMLLGPGGQGTPSEREISLVLERLRATLSRAGRRGRDA